MSIWIQLGNAHEHRMRSVSCTHLSIVHVTYTIDHTCKRACNETSHSIKKMTDKT